MAFIPPVFSVLRVNTLNLDTTFSTKLGRYKIVGPIASSDSSKDSSKKPPSSLQVLIDRTQLVIDSKTDRTTARDVFNQLVNELREVLRAGNEDQNNRGAMFLLGALLHRYFRLIKEQDNAKSFTLSLFKIYNVKTCRLFQAIRLALRLSKETLEEYRTRDLAILDVTTIVTALEEFQNNMVDIKDADKVPRYKKYPHLAQDRNFEHYLKEIIEEHRKRGLPILDQFKAIHFVQSLAKKVEVQCVQVEEELAKWCKILEKEHADFSVLSLKTIEAHIDKNIQVESARERILDLLYTDHIKTNLASMDHADFLAKMKKCQTDRATYTICGGYTLLLQSQGIDDLKFCIYQALGIEEKPKEYTDKDKLIGIKFMQEYLKCNPDVVLDCEFFGGKDEMNTLIAEKYEELVTRIAKKQDLRAKKEGPREEKEGALIPHTKEVSEESISEGSIAAFSV